MMDMEEELKLKPNKNLLKVYIQEKTGKHVTLRDISNIGAKLRKKNDHTHHSDLIRNVQRLKDIDG